LEKKIERGRVSMSERQIVGKRNEEREERDGERKRRKRKEGREEDMAQGDQPEVAQ